MTKGFRPALSSTMLDFEADRGQPLDDLVERGVGLEVILEPGEGEFHDCVPRLGWSTIGLGTLDALKGMSSASRPAYATKGQSARAHRRCSVGFDSPSNPAASMSAEHEDRCRCLPARCPSVSIGDRRAAGMAPHEPARHRRRSSKIFERPLPVKVVTSSRPGSRRRPTLGAPVARRQSPQWQIAEHDAVSADGLEPHRAAAASPPGVAAHRSCAQALRTASACRAAGSRNAPASARRRRRRRAGPACRISAWRCGRCPCPRQNPGIRRGRARRARSTLGCTMPQPRISIQSLPSPKRTSPGRERSHWMSTSRLGSVNGKKLGRKRILTSAPRRRPCRTPPAPTSCWRRWPSCRSPAPRPDGTSASGWRPKSCR